MTSKTLDMINLELKSLNETYLQKNQIQVIPSVSGSSVDIPGQVLTGPGPEQLGPGPEQLEPVSAITVPGQAPSGSGPYTGPPVSS